MGARLRVFLTREQDKTLLRDFQIKKYPIAGDLRQRWANKPLNTTYAERAFKTAWLTLNSDVFAAYKASLGLIFGSNFGLSPIRSVLRV